MVCTPALRSKGIEKESTLILLVISLKCSLWKRVWRADKEGELKESLDRGKTPFYTK